MSASIAVKIGMARDDKEMARDRNDISLVHNIKMKSMKDNFANWKNICTFAS